MPTDIEPIIDNWYQHLDKGQLFRVVAIDSEDGVVEVQHFDGDLEEIPLDAWRQLELDLAEQPENWSGPLDVAEEDDLGEGITDTTRDDWNAPLAEVKPPPEKEQP